MYTVLIQMLCYIAFKMMELAYAYQTEGYGLTPLIALPVATLAIALPLAWEFTQWLHPDVDEFEHIELEHAHCGRCGRLTDLINGQCKVGCAWSTKADRAAPR